MTFNKGELYYAVVDEPENPSDKMVEIIKIIEIVEITESSDKFFIGCTKYIINKAPNRHINDAWYIPKNSMGSYFTAELINPKDNPEYFL